MDYASLYDKWAADNGKVKTLAGFETWKQSLAAVLSESPSAPYKLELTPLADLNPQELVVEKMGLKPMPRDILEQKIYKQMMEQGLRAPIMTSAWPDRLGASIDFRKHPSKPLTSVKDQVNCGSCYLFGCVAALECFLSLHVLRGPLSASIAIQPLLSCSVGREGAYGCEGGEQYTTCEQILAPCFQRGGGVYTETAMPYAFLQKTVADACDFQMSCAEYMSPECRSKKATGNCNVCMPVCGGRSGTPLLGCALASDPRRLAISANVRTQIIPFPGGVGAPYTVRDKVYYDTLKMFGPFPVCVQAGVTTNSSRARKTVDPWPLYKKGLLAPPLTERYSYSSPINHLILLVGATPEAWICKNSWDKTWGEGGYVLIPRGKQWGSCGAWSIVGSEPIVFIL